MSSSRPRQKPLRSSSRLRRAAAAGALGLALALPLASCLAPTLPLPPPESPDAMRALADGRWEIRGDCNPGALVIGLVDRSGEGAVVEDRDADGRYRLVVDAELRDVVLLTQTDGTESSASTRVVVVTTTNGRITDGAACSR